MEQDTPMGEPVQKRARGRPANQRSLSQSEEAAIPPYLASFLHQITHSLEVFKTSLVKEIKSVISESLSKPIVETISSRIDKVVTDSFSNIVPTASPKSTYAQVVAANIDMQKYPEKNSQAVICNVPESDDPKETEEADRAALKALFQATSLNDGWESGKIEWFRHPKESPRDSTRRGRPIKVKFPSQQDQVTFLREADKARRTIFSEEPHIFVRRDFTPRELEIDRELRKECGKRNNECGMVKFVVRDLEIYEIKKPKYEVNRKTQNTAPKQDPKNSNKNNKSNAN